MKTAITGFAATVLLAVIPASASAAPDIIAFTNRIDGVSAFLAGKDLCEAVGYTYAPQVVENTIKPTVAQAVKDGMAEDMAHGMMKASLQAAAQEEITLWKEFRARSAAAGRANDPAAVRANADALYKTLDTRCGGFARSAEFKTYITAPESGGYKHFYQWLLAKWEAE